MSEDLPQAYYDFLKALPCVRCAIQKGELVYPHPATASTPVVTPWGLIPACESCRHSASNAFAWKKLSTNIDTLGAALERAARRDDQLAARRAYAAERNRAFSRPLDAAVQWQTPIAGESAAKAGGKR